MVYGGQTSVDATVPALNSDGQRGANEQARKEPHGLVPEPALRSWQEMCSRAQVSRQTFCLGRSHAAQS